MTQDPHKMQYNRFGALKSFAVGVCVFSFGSVLAAWLNRHNVHGLLAFVDNIVTGIAAGLMVLFYERRRHRDIEKKLQTIRLMNHHVRNALQAIYAASSNLDTREQSTRVVHDAVKRIEWALRKVLPGETNLTYADAPPNPESPNKESID